jgi:hypothetical protein
MTTLASPRTTKKASSSKKVERKKTAGEEVEGKEEEEEEEWLPIEEVEGEEEEEGEEKPRERGTRTNGAAPESKGEREQAQQQQQLSCFATSRETAECSWNWPASFEQKNNPLIGFRTVLSSTLTGVLGWSLPSPKHLSIKECPPT